MLILVLHASEPSAPTPSKFMSPSSKRVVVPSSASASAVRKAPADIMSDHREPSFPPARPAPARHYDDNRYEMQASMPQDHSKSSDELGNGLMRAVFNFLGDKTE
jgi:hypothetical protein